MQAKAKAEVGRRRRALCDGHLSVCVPKEGEHGMFCFAVLIRQQSDINKGAGAAVWKCAEELLIPGVQRAAQMEEACLYFRQPRQ